MKNEYTVDWLLLKKWTNESRFSGIRLFFFVSWCVLLTVFIVFIVLSIVTSIYDYMYYFVLFAILSIYYAFFQHTIIAKKQYKRLAQIYGKSSWVRTISFEENEIVVNDEKAETKYKYSDILEIVEKDERIYLKLPAKSVLRLYKSKFVDCSWEDCKKRIIDNNSNLK